MFETRFHNISKHLDLSEKKKKNCSVLRFSACLEILWNTISRKICLTHLDIIPPFPDIREPCSIWTVQNIIRRYPLVSVLSSLSVNTCHLHWPSHVNLQPLVMIVMAWGPGPHDPTTFCTVKSRQPRGMVCIPLRRGCHGRILDTAILNSDRTIAEILCENKDVQEWGFSLCCLKLRYIHFALV